MKCVNIAECVANSVGPEHGILILVYTVCSIWIHKLGAQYNGHVNNHYFSEKKNKQSLPSLRTYTTLNMLEIIVSQTLSITILMKDTRLQYKIQYTCVPNVYKYTVPIDFHVFYA